MSEFVIPSLDLLGGEVVRLTRGDFATVQRYGTPDEVLHRWNVESGRLLHVVDLDGSRRGELRELRTIARLARRGLRVQAGGGVRSAEDALTLLDAGAEKVVIGTAMTGDAAELDAIVRHVGSERIVAAVDVRDGVVRVSGWEAASPLSLADVMARLTTAGIEKVLVTDISTDGTLAGPSFDLYRTIWSAPVPGALSCLPDDQRTQQNKAAGTAALQSRRPSIIASGGVGTLSDIRALSRLRGVSGVVIGKALHEQRFTLAEADDVARERGIAERIIPCLDIRGGRVVKGVRFANLRDAGDPVECAMRYEAEGADELVVLDVSATMEERTASLETIRRISERLFIPLTVGGGVKNLDDFRLLLQNGADRVAINTAAVLDPALISTCAAEFGVQAVVVACDARRMGGRASSPPEQAGIVRSPGFEVVVKSGTEAVALDAVEWCVEAERRGAGELLLTSVDADGTTEGYDVQLLREVSSRVRIGVIASGGAGKLVHFRDAIERGGARAVLAASLFHDRKLSIGEVKEYLRSNGIHVRSASEGGRPAPAPSSDRDGHSVVEDFVQLQKGAGAGRPPSVKGIA